MADPGSGQARKRIALLNPAKGIRIQQFRCYCQQEQLSGKPFYARLISGIPRRQKAREADLAEESLFQWIPRCDEQENAPPKGLTSLGRTDDCKVGFAQTLGRNDSAFSSVDSILIGR
jgi:hypothetical protein